MRLIEISFPTPLADKVAALLRGSTDPNWTIVSAKEGASSGRVLVATSEAQALVDGLHALLATRSDWRIVVLPVEAAVLPANANHLQIRDEPKSKTDETTALREEIYQSVSEGTRIDQDFFILTVLSAIVAAIGMVADNVAVVIGAMVIAPLLGPLLAFSFASAIGDAELMRRATRTSIAGLIVGFGTAFLLGAMLDVSLPSRELLDRTVLGLDSIVIALASGAAAALTVATGKSSALVGVMVAVALLPPSVAVALFLGSNQPELAGRSALLLSINVISVILASMVVFRVKGVKPRTWHTQETARRSQTINLVVWGSLLAALAVLILLKFR